MGVKSLLGTQLRPPSQCWTRSDQNEVIQLVTHSPIELFTWLHCTVRHALALPQPPPPPPESYSFRRPSYVNFNAMQP